ncbi:hypothetical protein BCR33DRAFT_109257 [Rhizoclosmatium globosum]|uniref:Uncharacterized protein n=1 Tax=Rhizoclosmatium globosum TaxID=329046 RepID=A0A1Y2CI69_9FUNG|nr:hypothetical protein BCR33DRAFT_109257 [Rhizoclosmatium globosum]|eukprot:ORY46751.1 hypothetical protein BCR33DRAFT_109257 [Rhizoclosmatium globosum]
MPRRQRRPPFKHGPHSSFHCWDIHVHSNTGNIRIRKPGTLDLWNRYSIRINPSNNTTQFETKIRDLISNNPTTRGFLLGKKTFSKSLPPPLNSSNTQTRIFHRLNLHNPSTHPPPTFLSHNKHNTRNRHPPLPHPTLKNPRNL